MCPGIPGKVIDTYREHDVLMGKVDFSGIQTPLGATMAPAEGVCAA
jgi:hydrogenase expression/formation protein HypC